MPEVANPSRERGLQRVDEHRRDVEAGLLRDLLEAGRAGHVDLGHAVADDVQAHQQPLVKKFQLGCARTFVAGTVSITNSKEKSMLLNYDPTNTQACDNLASLTINGKTKVIRCGR